MNMRVLLSTTIMLANGWTNETSPPNLQIGIPCFRLIGAGTSRMICYYLRLSGVWAERETRPRSPRTPVDYHGGPGESQAPAIYYYYY